MPRWSREPSWYQACTKKNRYQTAADIRGQPTRPPATGRERGFSCHGNTNHQPTKTGTPVLLLPMRREADLKTKKSREEQMWPVYRHTHHVHKSCRPGVGPARTWSLPYSPNTRVAQCTNTLPVRLQLHVQGPGSRRADGDGFQQILAQYLKNFACNNNK